MKKIPNKYIINTYIYGKLFGRKIFQNPDMGGLGSARVGASMGLQDASRAGETWGCEDSGVQTPPVELDVHWWFLLADVWPKWSATICPQNSMLMSWGVLCFVGGLLFAWTPGYDLLCVAVTSSGAEVQLDSSCGGHKSTGQLRECRRNKAWLPNHAPIQYRWFQK